MGKKKESKLVKYPADRNQHSLSFCYAGASFDCSCNGGIEKGWQVYDEAVTDSFNDRCTDADVKSNSHCGIM